MDDPCRHCENIDERAEYLSRQFNSRFNGDGSGQLLNQILKKYEETEQKYKHLIECAPDAIFIADKETGIILDANQQAARLIGRPVEQIIGMYQWQLHPGEEKNKYQQLFYDHIHNETLSISEDMFVCRKDGSKVPVQINASLTRIDGKKAMFGIFRDVTEQKELEQKLAESEQKYRQLYNHAQIALYRTRIGDGKLMECNDALTAMLGYDSKEQCLSDCYAAKHYADPLLRSELIRRLRNEGSLTCFEIEFVRCDGSHGWAELTAKIYPDEGYIEGAHHDITISKVLTETEKKILCIILQGKSNKEIAKDLKRSIRTIEDHRAHIMQKLHAHNLVELVQRAQSNCFWSNT